MGTYPDQYTKLLLHFNGADASTTIIEAGGRPITPHENAQLDTAQSKFGGSSLLLDGFGDFIDTPDHADFDIGMSEFAIDFHVRFASLPAAYQTDHICGHGDAGQNRWHLYLYNNSVKYDLYFVAYEGDNPVLTIVATNLTISANIWYHFALTAKAEGTGRRFRIFQDGFQKIGGGGTFSTQTIPNPVGSFRIGSQYGDENFLNAWVDEFRVSVGTYRWADTFTVPTEEYQWVANFTDVPFNLLSYLGIDIPAFETGLSLANSELNAHHFNFTGTPFILLLSGVSDDVYISSFGEWTIPLWTIEGSGRAEVNEGALQIPLWEIEGTGLVGAIGGGDLRIPLWAMEGFGAGCGEWVIPLWTIEGVGTVGVVGRGEWALPLPVIAGEGMEHEIGGGNLLIPLWTIQGEGKQSVFGGGDLMIPAFRIEGHGYAGVIGGGDLAFPLWTIQGTGIALATGGGDLRIPLWVINGYGRVIAAKEIVLPLVMNINNKAVTEYLNFAFNSLCKFNGKFYAANRNGIYLLEGESDDTTPIEARIKTGVLDLGQPAIKRPRYAWMTYRAPKGIVLFVQTDEEEEIWEEEFPVIWEKIHEARAKIARGLKNRFMTFGLKNKDGSAFDIDTLRIFGDVIAHRRR